MDAEPPLILENINVFITYVTKARVEDLETDPEKVRKALERLCEFLLKGHGEVDACTRYGITELEVDVASSKKYASSAGIPNPSEDDLQYIRMYIFGQDITEMLSINDQRTLSIGYLEEIPFIRLDLREITITLGSDFPVQGLKDQKLTCHPIVIVHRLGAAAVTFWVEIPIPLTAEDTNKLIHALMEGQAEIEVQRNGEIEASPLEQYVGSLAGSLLAPLIRILRGEEPALERTQREDIMRYIRYIERITTLNIVLHVGGVSMGEDNYALPTASAEYLVGRCPRQVASLATGLMDWRSYALDKAVEDYREALAAIYRDQLVLAGTRGVVIYLGRPREPDFDFLKNAKDALRDRDHERRHHSVLQSFAPNVLQIYQLVGIVRTALESYNLRTRRYPLERARPGEIERLLDLVQRGLEEIDNYSLVTADPPRTVLRKALGAHRVLRLRKVVERRLDHIHRILGERALLKINIRLLALTILLVAFSIVQIILTALGMGFGLVLANINITAASLTALLLIVLILGSAPRLWRVFRSLARL